jgi:hypothetical protein
MASFPKITDKIRESRKKINEIDYAIQEAIDKVCEKYDYKITPEEINLAVNNILNRNLGRLVRELWDDENENKERK